MNKFLLINILSCFFILACGNDKKLQSNLPAMVRMVVDPIQKIEKLNKADNTAPTTVADFDCLILNVTGSDIAETSNLGLLSSMVSLSNGGTMSVEVPIGDNLLFEVIGVVSNVGCSSVAKSELLSTTNYPVLTVLGSRTEDVTGDIEITITNSYEGTTATDVRTGSTLRQPIGAAPRRPTGRLDTFVRLTTDLPVSIQAAAAVQHANKIFLIGGNIGATPDPTSIGLSQGTTDAVFEATLNSDGTIGAFTLSAFRLNTERKGARAEVIGDYLYVIGGENNSGNLTNIERADLNDSGLASAFTSYTQTLDTERYNFLTLVTPGYIFAIGGGYDGNYDSTIVDRATVNTTTGEIGAFQTLTRTAVSGTEATDGLVDNRWTHNSIRLGDNIYILGGEGIDTIEKVIVQSDGLLGNFVKLNDTLPQARNRLQVIALFGYAYVFGGWNGTFLSTVEKAPIVNNELGTFTTDGTVTLFEAVEDTTSLLTEKGVFVFGGYNHTNGIREIIQFAPIVEE